MLQIGIVKKKWKIRCFFFLSLTKTTVAINESTITAFNSIHGANNSSLFGATHMPPTGGD